MIESSLRTLSVSPRLLAALYYRCTRCLYDHVRAADDRHVPGSSFRAAGVAAIEAVQGPDGWIDIPGALPVRILSNRIRTDSTPVPFPELGVQLTFSPHPETVLESTDGKKILCAFRRREANAQVRSVLRCSLEAGALAAEHPIDPAEKAQTIDELGIIEFALRLVPVRGTGAPQQVLQPARLIRLKREPERFAMFLRVVARILASQKAPPPSTDCPHCIGIRAGEKIPA